jgi:tripartite-type tricarboxylate transporter receptor subunit TctC
MYLKKFTAALACATVSLVAMQQAMAQSYPNKPIKLVVPFAPGGTTDVIARIVAAAIPAHLNGQSMIVENRAGAGGALGAGETAAAAPDGYSLGVATVSTIATVPALNPKTKYDPVNDFTPIINIAATPNILTVHPSFPAKDYAGFLDLVKKNPGKYSYASSGTGSILHLQMELFKTLTKTDIVHVPYRGSGPALNDAIAGQVPMIFDNLPSSLSHVQGGKLVPIVVAASQRSSALPNVPTFKDVGLPAMDRMAFYGIYGPKGLPRDIVDTINRAVKQTLADPNVRKRVEDTGSIIIANTPEEFAKEIKEEFEVYKRVVAEQNLKPE